MLIPQGVCDKWLKRTPNEACCAAAGTDCTHQYWPKATCLTRCAEPFALLISRRHLCCPPCGVARVSTITELQWACQPAARRFF